MESLEKELETYGDTIAKNPNLIDWYDITVCQCTQDKTVKFLDERLKYISSIYKRKFSSLCTSTDWRDLISYFDMWLDHNNEYDLIEKFCEINSIEKEFLEYKKSIEIEK